jgi:hypothetical protein
MKSNIPKRTSFIIGVAVAVTPRISGCSSSHQAALSKSPIEVIAFRYNSSNNTVTGQVQNKTGETLRGAYVVLRLTRTGDFMGEVAVNVTNFAPYETKLIQEVLSKDFRWAKPDRAEVSYVATGDGIQYVPTVAQ